MKTFEQFGIKIPKILLPKKLDTETWATVACDQYTQDREYWKKAEECAKSKPSTLNLILPEVYLNDKDKNEKILKIRKNMQTYLDEGIFEPEKEEFIYIERTTSHGRTRKGLIVAIDLEKYEWKPFSTALIRATEATIVERIPPRMEIRDGAPLELPHIMLLVNDPEKLLVEETGILARKRNEQLYSGNLMLGGGSIKGWAVSTQEEMNRIEKSLEKLSAQNTCSDGSVFLFAVGDGNHSLATAKSVWEKYKNEHPEVKNDVENPVRYALVEIVNIYDEGLTFEPIHRVLFNIDSKELIKDLCTKLEGTTEEINTQKELEESVKNSSSNFGFTFMENGKQSFVLLKTDINELAVSRLQPALDVFLKTAPKSHICDEKGCRTVKAEIDYIHGSDEIFRLGKQENTTGILLPPVAKDSFFATISARGPLPRKSFSMGEADEKRFYLECRKLFS